MAPPKNTKYYSIFIDGQRMPVEVLTRRHFTLDDDYDEYSRPIRFVKYQYVKVTHDKKLYYAEGKQRASVFKVNAYPLTKEEYETKLLTLKSLYGNKEGDIQSERDANYYWSLGD